MSDFKRLTILFVIVVLTFAVIMAITASQVM